MITLSYFFIEKNNKKSLNFSHVCKQICSSNFKEVCEFSMCEEISCYMEFAIFAYSIFSRFGYQCVKCALISTVKTPTIETKRGCKNIKSRDEFSS